MSEAVSDAPAQGELRVVSLICYGLFLLALVNGITAIAGVILAYIKRDEARGTVWESHMRNLIRVFWVGVVLAGAALVLILPALSTLIYALIATDGHPPPPLVGGLVATVPILWLAGLAFLVWYLYRTIGGFARALDGKAY
ncbi:MAG: hypothetical protein WDN01_19040 [Rhizomicrobium sp.]